MNNHDKYLKMFLQEKSYGKMDKTEKHIEILEEEFYGNQAIVYHRTKKPLEEIESNFTKGFKIGKGDMYGKGIYTNYELEDCFSEYSLEHYGEYIIKCKVSLHGFLILDYDIANQVYGKDGYRLTDQFRRLKIPKYDDIVSDSEYLEKLEYTSIVLDTIRKQVYPYVNGVIYNGKSDNRSMVVYGSNSIIPMSVTKAKKMEEVNWFRLDKTHTIRNYLNVMGKILEKDIKHTIQLKSGIHILTDLEKFVNNMNWNEANSFCNNLEYKNFSNWRLPTKDELLEIYEYYNTHTDEFDYISPGIFWTSTQKEDELICAMHIKTGALLFAMKGNHFHIWPVRDSYK